MADSGTPVLRTGNGDRVFDETDIPALMALAELAILIERRWVNHVATGELPSSAAESHRRTHGHRLDFGCCARHNAKTAIRTRVA